jgi:hypothetical protein
MKETQCSASPFPTQHLCLDAPQWQRVTPNLRLIGKDLVTLIIYHQGCKCVFLCLQCLGKIETGTEAKYNALSHP